MATTSAIRRGDAYPAPILPASEAILPIPSAPIFLQMSAETTTESHIRHKLQHKLRKALKREHYMPVDQTFVMLSENDDDETVEGARLKAAQMQAQLDEAVEKADAKREQQRKEFNSQTSDDPAAQLQGLMNA